jgi:hypothetical protein
MDVSEATGAIAVGGKTNDPSLIGSSSIGTYYPFLLFYEPEKLSRKWEKYANLPTSDVISMGFNPNGNELFAFFQINCVTITDCRNVIMLLQSFDGKVLFQRRFTDEYQIKNYVGNYAYLDSNRRIV